MVGSISKLSLYVNCKSVLCRILYIVEGEEQKQYARTLVQVCIFRTFCMAHRDVSMMWESHSSYKWQIARLRDFKIYLYKFSKILTLSTKKLRLPSCHYESFIGLMKSFEELHFENFYLRCMQNYRVLFDTLHIFYKH